MADLSAPFRDVENPPPPYRPGEEIRHEYQHGQPPTYDETVDPTEPPPSYDSLFGRVKQAKQESSGGLGFMRQLSVIIMSTLGCTVCLGILLAIPISMITIGAMYLDNCPAERYIPIYLIVAGVFGAIRSLSSIGQRAKNRQTNRDDDNASTNPLDGILSCFLFAWFIAGNVWIYRTYGYFQSDDSDLLNYCHPTLFWFAFWITTVSYILLAFACSCICCAACLAACVS